MDTLIKNGLLITAKGCVKTSIGIKDGLIAGLYGPGEEPTAQETIDASGLAVLPGIIDMHSHHREGSEPGFEYKDTIYTSTLQCAAGGVTTSIAMPNVNPPPNSVNLLKKQFAIYERDAIVDWNFTLTSNRADSRVGFRSPGRACCDASTIEETPRLPSTCAGEKIVSVPPTDSDVDYSPTPW